MKDTNRITLANHLEQFKILNLELARSIFNVRNTNLELTRAILDIQNVLPRVAESPLPISKVGSGLLAVLFTELWVVYESLSLFEAWVDTDSANEDILASTGTWCGVRVAHIEMHIEICDARHIELVLRVVTCPEGVFWSSGDGVDEDLDLVEV